MPKHSTTTHTDTVAIVGYLSQYGVDFGRVVGHGAQVHDDQERAQRPRRRIALLTHTQHTINNSHSIITPPFATVRIHRDTQMAYARGPGVAREAFSLLQILLVARPQVLPSIARTCD